MQIVWQRDTNRLLKSVTYKQDIDFTPFKIGVYPITLTPIDNTGNAVVLDDPYIGIKLSGDIDGDWLALENLVVSGDNYIGELNLNTVTMISALSGDEFSIDGWLEIGDRDSYSTLTKSVTIQNRLLTDDVPVDLPTSNDWLSDRAVRYDVEQSLTNEEKAQAKANIGVSDGGDAGTIGGSTGQVLAKASNTDFDVEWTSLSKSDVGLSNVDNTTDLLKPISTATQNALNAKAASSHSHIVSDITDFDTEVANNSAVTANTAKVTNATHTGDVTGATALTIAAGAVDESKCNSTINASLDLADSALQDSDTSTGGNGAADDGKVVKFISDGSLDLGHTVITTTATIYAYGIAGWNGSTNIALVIPYGLDLNDTDIINVHNIFATNIVAAACNSDEIFDQSGSGHPKFPNGLAEAVSAEVCTLPTEGGTLAVQSEVITDATGVRTLALSDKGKYIIFTHGTATVLTIPTNASVEFPIGTEIYFRRGAIAGAITLSNAGVTINGGASIADIEQNDNFALKKVATDEWDFI
jgi:hypothetical protein